MLACYLKMEKGLTYMGPMLEIPNPNVCEREREREVNKSQTS
jgi:hypothetical protein